MGCVDPTAICGHSIEVSDRLVRNTPDPVTCHPPALRVIIFIRRGDYPDFDPVPQCLFKQQAASSRMRPLE